MAIGWGGDKQGMSYKVIVFWQVEGGKAGRIRPVLAFRRRKTTSMHEIIIPVIE
jgi:hypothetical protein